MTADERMTPNRLGGVLLGVAGVVVLIGPAALHELGLQLLAQIAVLGAALSYALAGIFGRRFRDVPPLVSAAGQVSATTIMMLPVRPVAGRTLEGSAARSVDLGCDPRPCPAEHCARLSHLLSPPGERGGDQPAPGHLSDPGQRDRPGREPARRTPGAAAFRRHGADRPRARGDRWPIAPPAAPARRPTGARTLAGLEIDLSAADDGDCGSSGNADRCQASATLGTISRDAAWAGRAGPILSLCRGVDLSRTARLARSTICVQAPAGQALAEMEARAHAQVGPRRACPRLEAGLNPRALLDARAADLLSPGRGQL